MGSIFWQRHFPQSFCSRDLCQQVRVLQQKYCRPKVWRHWKGVYHNWVCSSQFLCFHSPVCRQHFQSNVWRKHWHFCFHSQEVRHNDRDWRSWDRECRWSRRRNPSIYQWSGQLDRRSFYHRFPNVRYFQNQHQSSCCLIWTKPF